MMCKKEKKKMETNDLMIELEAIVSGGERRARSETRGTTEETNVLELPGHTSGLVVTLVFLSCLSCWW